MVQGFHDPNFSEQLLQTAGVKLRFINDLDGNLFASGNVLGQLDLGKVTLTNGLQKSIFADVRLLSRPAARHAGARLTLQEENIFSNFQKKIFCATARY